MSAVAKKTIVFNGGNNSSNSSNATNNNTNTTAVKGATRDAGAAASTGVKDASTTTVKPVRKTISLSHVLRPSPPALSDAAASGSTTLTGGVKPKPPRIAWSGGALQTNKAEAVAKFLKRKGMLQGALPAGMQKLVKLATTPSFDGVQLFTTPTLHKKLAETDAVDDDGSSARVNNSGRGGGRGGRGGRGRGRGRNGRGGKRNKGGKNKGGKGGKGFGGVQRSGSAGRGKGNKRRRRASSNSGGVGQGNGAAGNGAVLSNGSIVTRKKQRVQGGFTASMRKGGAQTNVNYGLVQPRRKGTIRLA